MQQSYQILFPNESLQKKFLKILDTVHPKAYQEAIRQKIRELKTNPRPQESSSFRNLRGKGVRISKYTAQYRLRIGGYRVLYDVDDTNHIVWILALRKRDESAYK